ncbi:hypothetical protein BJ978_003198 [Agromyces terreus]|uniref:DUF4232 domain-containing protein n=1 Tax=Agromyces terreus TaxID=424795 RepID=A0A9X2KG68_9MICO|nr:DUF4232 domain-containing protein [Agromyces terreus]MCP2372522.1 hypothetical protein [Agromyces terreus]
MRVARWIVPPVVAIAAWFASGWIAHAGMASGSSAATRITRVLAPDTLPVGASAPGPWGPLAVLASALAIGGGFALLALLLRAGRGTPGFAAGWLAAVLAGTAVAALPVFGTVIAGLVASTPFVLPTTESAAVGAYWGVLWGWLPALAVVAFEPARAVTGSPAQTTPATPTGPRRAHRRPVAVAAAAALVGLIAVAAIVPAADQAWHRAISAEAADSDGELHEPSEPIPTGTPAPDVAPGDWTVDPTWCTENQLEFTASEPDSAAGTRGMRVTAVNVSSAPCVLDGYPDLAFSAITTGAVDVRVLHGGGLAEPDAGPVELTVEPGSGVEAELSWRAPAASDLEPADFVLVAPYAGAVRTYVPARTDITGGDVEVTAWRTGS